MGNSRDEIVTQKCFQTYMDTNIKNDLKYISKSFLNGFNCGYNTSSIAESSNSRLKILLPSRSITLKDIRIALSSAEHLSTLSKQFINERKIKDSMLINVMKKFEISENIANSICDAIIKAQELKFDVIHSEPKVLAHVEEVDDSFEPYLQKKYHSFNRNEKSFTIKK